MAMRRSSSALFGAVLALVAMLGLVAASSWHSAMVHDHVPVQVAAVDHDLELLREGLGKPGDHLHGLDDFLLVGGGLWSSRLQTRTDPAVVMAGILALAAAGWAMDAGASSRVRFGAVSSPHAGCMDERD